MRQALRTLISARAETSLPIILGPGRRGVMALDGDGKSSSNLGGFPVRFHTILAAVLVAAAAVGCSTAPIVNVNDAAVASPSGKPLSHDQVRGAIVRAGASLGWQMKDEGPNMMVGTLQLRKHTAVVEIPYSASSYSIKYRSSVNLDENGGTIHKNYNGWIQNLTRGINSQLSTS
jgi:hypothetical protein